MIYFKSTFLTLKFWKQRLRRWCTYMRLQNKCISFFWSCKEKARTEQEQISSGRQLCCVRFQMCDLIDCDFKSWNQLCYVHLIASSKTKNNLCGRMTLLKIKYFMFVSCRWWSLFYGRNSGEPPPPPPHPKKKKKTVCGRQQKLVVLDGGDWYRFVYKKQLHD